MKLSQGYGQTCLLGGRLDCLPDSSLGVLELGHRVVSEYAVRLRLVDLPEAKS